MLNRTYSLTPAPKFPVVKPNTQSSENELGEGPLDPFIWSPSQCLFIESSLSIVQYYPLVDTLQWLAKSSQSICPKNG